MYLVFGGVGVQIVWVGHIIGLQGKHIAIADVFLGGSWRKGLLTSGLQMCKDKGTDTSDTFSLFYINHVFVFGC